MVGSNGGPDMLDMLTSPYFVPMTTRGGEVTLIPTRTLLSPSPNPEPNLDPF